MQIDIDSHNKLIALGEEFYTTRNYELFSNNATKFLIEYCKKSFNGKFVYCFNSVIKNDAEKDNPFDLKPLLASGTQYGNSNTDISLQILRRFFDVHKYLREFKKIDSLTNLTLHYALDPTLTYDSGICGELVKFKKFERLAYGFNIVDTKDIIPSNNIKAFFNDFLIHKSEKFTKNDLIELIEKHEYLPTETSSSSVMNFLATNSIKNAEHASFLIATFEIYKVVTDLCFNLGKSKQFNYHLRPKMFYKYYNGLVGLMLTEELSLNEYLSFDLINRELFSQTMIGLTERYAKDAEWKTIVDEMSHSYHHHLGVARRRIKELAISGANHDDAKIKKEYAKCNAIIDDLADTNDLEYALMKITENSFSNLPASLKVVFENKEVKLSDYLIECVEYIRDSIDLIDLSFTEHYKALTQNCIPKLFENITKDFSNYYGNFALIAVKIVLMDLIKNALKATDILNPITKIYVIENENMIELHITNNAVMSENAFRFIAYGAECEGFSKTQKVGIRTVKRILSTQLISSGNKKWKMDINPESTDSNKNETDIYLIIPKTDIYKKILKTDIYEENFNSSY